MDRGSKKEAEPEALYPAERSRTMKYWEISYYKTHNWIDTKYIKDEYAQGAINKARVKNIVDVQETTEEDYKAGLAKRKAAAQAKKARRAELEQYII
jgi:hypothetical protein